MSEEICMSMGPSDEGRGYEIPYGWGVSAPEPVGPLPQLSESTRRDLQELRLPPAFRRRGAETVDDANKLKELKEENARLRRLLAKAMVASAMLTEIAAESADGRPQA
jgi:hypothetical protein